MSGLDMLSNNKRARSYASYTPTGFGEIAGTRFIATAYESPDSIVNIPASFDAIREIEKRNTLIKQRFNVDDPYAVIDVSDIDERYSNPTTDGRIKANKEKLERLDVYIQEQRKSRPDLWGDIKTKAEIDQPMIGRAREARKVADETISRAESGFAAVGGSLAGGFGGAMTGAVNLATLPLGFSASRGILQTMAMEGVLNASLEAAQIPMRKEWMDTLGHKYGLKEAAMDVAFAGAGAAALTGVIRGAGRGIRAFRDRGSRGMEVMTRMSDDISVPKEGRDALKYQSRVAHIDEEIPVSGATREDVAVHRANVVETERAIQENRAPVYEEFEGVNIIPEEMAHLWDKAAEIKQSFSKLKSEIKGIKEKKPQSLSQFIKNTGGIIDRGGEFKSQDINLPGLIRKQKARVGTLQGVLVIDNQIDAVRQRVFDAGYFPEKESYDDITNDELFQAIKDDLSGKKIYKASDREDAVDNAALAYRSLEESGFSEEMTVQQIFDELVAKNFEGRQSIESNVFDEPFPDSHIYNDDFENNGGFEAMRATIEAAEETAPTFDADFARLLKDNPDMKLDMDGETISLKEISARIKEDADIINAMKVCAVG